MKAKKVLALIVAVMMTAALVAGCGSSNSGGGGSTADAGASNNAADGGDTQPAAPSNPDAIVLRLADVHPETYPTVMGAQVFADLVSERTDGAIEIQIYANGVLGDEGATLEQLQFGAIDFVRISTNLLSSVNNDYNALSMPFLYQSRDHMFRVLDGEIGDEFLSKAYDQGVLGLCWYDAGARNLYNSSNEVHAPSDLNGLKVRVQENNLMLNLLNAMGASATTMAYSEIYSGIQNGVIDGAENNWPSYMSASHYEVAPYFTVSQHVMAPEFIAVSTSTWEKLTEEQQEIVKQAALESATFERDEWARQEAAYEEEAVAAGVTVTYLTDEERAVFTEAVQSVYEMDEFSSLLEIVDRIRAVS